MPEGVDLPPASTPKSRDSREASMITPPMSPRQAASASAEFTAELGVAEDARCAETLLLPATPTSRRHSVGPTEP